MNKRNTDHRLFVLILLVAAILFFEWRSTKNDAQLSLYFWKDGALIRASTINRSGVLLTEDLPCAATPPELAAFFHLPLPVNRADQAALLRLPGIGPKLAENIISFRAEHGGITGPDDLLKVKGIGPKRLANLTPLICFDANH